MRDLAAFIFAALLAPAVPAIAAAAPIQLGWTTDYNSPSQINGYPTTFGPDGPWQAVDVNVGNTSVTNSPSGPGFLSILMPLYPCGSSVTSIDTSNGWELLLQSVVHCSPARNFYGKFRRLVRVRSHERIVARNGSV